jgi:hypothetical protein
VAETIVLPGENALRFIRPACQRGSEHKRHATYNDIEPYLEHWFEDFEDDTDEQWVKGTGWIAVKRVEDSKIFVADFFDRSTSPYFRDEEYMVDHFGGVQGWLTAEGELFLVTVLSTPDVEFKAAKIVRSEGNLKDRFYVLED